MQTNQTRLYRKNSALTLVQARLGGSPEFGGGAGQRRGMMASMRGRGEEGGRTPFPFPAVRVEYILSVGCGLEGPQLHSGWTVIGIPSTPRSSSPLAASTSGSREPAREAGKDTALGLTLRAPACDPPYISIGSLSLPRCARAVLLRGALGAPADGSPAGSRHGVVSHGACAPSMAPHAGVRRRLHQTWGGGRGKNWRRGDV